MVQVNEKDVIAVAKELAAHGSGQTSSVYSMSFWNEKLLGWAMARPAFKERLFRFVDVFPATNGSKDVMNHVREYLDADGVPKPLRQAIRTAATMPLGSTIVAHQARTNISKMAEQFILGSGVDTAVKGAARLWSQNRSVTVDLLGEKTVSEDEADGYARRVTETLVALGQSAKTWPKRKNEPRNRVSISIKPTALASRYAPLSREAGLSAAAERIRPILRQAMADNVFVWFDMEHHSAKDLTIQLFRELLSEDEFANVDAGIVLQAYLQETEHDLEQMIHWSAKRDKPVGIRLVKGAYWDTETIHAEADDWPIPVWTKKTESDAAYERCTAMLIEAHAQVRPAFASHNLRSLAHVVACARANKLSPNDYEIQVLYGMAEPMHEAVVAMGNQLRVYAPVGEMVPGMAYLVRRLLENTSNDSFVRQRFAEGRELEALLEKPVGREAADIRAHEREKTSSDKPSPYLPESPLQWHLQAVRDEFTRVLDHLDRKLEKNQRNPQVVEALIDGSRKDTSEHIVSVDPAQPEVAIAQGVCTTVEDVERAVASALNAQREWAKRTARERADVLFCAAKWMRDRRFELAALEVREAGKPWADADGDVCEAIDFCEYYGREAIRLEAGGAVQSTTGETNRLHYIPRGLCAVVSPWNFPLAIPTGMVTAALVMGNAVVFKPAEDTPLIAEKLVDALTASGLPRGVLQFLPGKGEVVGAALVSHRDVSCIAFTGSRQVGLGILREAAVVREGQRNIKRCIVELGGKNPMIVDTDADLDQVVPAVMASAFNYAGQKCSALSRLIVLDEVHDELVRRIVGALASVKVAAPSNMAADVGPVINAEAHLRITDVVNTAGKYGTVAASHSDIPETGFFVPPTIVANVDPTSPLAREEIFGPVLAVMRAKDINHALELANDTDYALTAGIFSRTPSNIRYLADSLRAGNVYINRTCTGAVVGRQPFGGWGISGGGTKAGGPDYLLQFTNPRVITENVVRQGFASTEG